MTPQPTCGECVETVEIGAWGAETRTIELCQRHAAAEDLYEAAKAVMTDPEIVINIRRETRWALRDAIATYEGK
jgi:hypothetical protein